MDRIDNLVSPLDLPRGGGDTARGFILTGTGKQVNVVRITGSGRHGRKRIDHDQQIKLVIGLLHLIKLGI